MPEVKDDAPAAAPEEVQDTAPSEPSLTVEDALMAMGAEDVLDGEKPAAVAEPAASAVDRVIPADATHVRVKMVDGPSFPVTVQNGNEAAVLKLNEETIITRAIFNALRDSDYEFEARPV